MEDERDGKVVLGCRGEREREKGKARGRAGWPCQEALGRREVRTEDAGKV